MTGVVAAFIAHAVARVAVIALAALSGPAVAMPASGAAAPPAIPASAMAERLQACMVCHGPEGVSTPDGYFPRIAGKPAGYLYQQLLNFRDGRRQNATMTYLVEFLSDDYLRAIAAHFAALDLPHAPPPAPAAPAAVLERGRRLALEGDAARDLPACAACHGGRLTGVQPSIPGLVGLPRDYLLAQVGAWRNGLRRAAAPDCMHTVAQRLAPEDLGAVTAWLAAQRVGADARPAAALPAPLPLDCGGTGP